MLEALSECASDIARELTIDKCPYKKKNNVRHRHKNLSHVEGVRLSKFECPAERNDTVRIDKSQWNATPRKSVTTVHRSMFWVGGAGRLTPPGELGVKERDPLEDCNDENEESNAIPCLLRVQLVSGGSQRLVGDSHE